MKSPLLLASLLFGVGILVSPGVSQAANVALSPGSAQNGFINITGAVNAGSLNVGGSASVGGTLAVNTIVPNGASALTIGSTAQSLNLQGANTTISEKNGVNTAQLTFVTPTSNVTYRLQTAAAGTYDICTTAGNCPTGNVSSAGGVVGAIPKYTGANTLGPSLLTDNGSAVTVGGNLSVTGAVTLPALAANGVLVGGGSSPVSSVTASGAGKCLVSTAGAPSFQTCPASAGGVTSLDGLVGALTLANSSGSGATVTIDNASTSAKGIASFNATNFSVTGGAVNTAQDIASTSTPTFAGINTNSIQSGNTTLNFASPTASRTVTVPDASGTVCLDSNNCNFQPAGNYQAAGNYVTLQDSNFVAQSGSIDVSGDVIAGHMTANGLSTINGTTFNNSDPTGHTGPIMVTQDVFARSVQNLAGSPLQVTGNNGLTIAANNSTFNIQSNGNGNMNIQRNSSAGNTTLNFATPTEFNKVITIPNLSGTICLDTNNCNFQTAGSYQPAGDYVTLQPGSPTPQAGNVSISGNLEVGNAINVANMLNASNATAYLGGAIFQDGVEHVSALVTGGINNTPGRGLLISSNEGIIMGSSASVEVSGTDLNMVKTGSNSSIRLTFAEPSGASKVVKVPNASGEVALVQTANPLVPQNGFLNISAAVIAGGLEIASSSFLHGTLSVDGATSLGGSLSIGGGTPIKKHLSATDAQGAQSLAGATGCNSFDVSVPGAALGDTVVAAVDKALPGSWMLSGGVSATDTVTVKACAFDNSTSIPAGTYRVDVWQH